MTDFDTKQTTTDRSNPQNSSIENIQDELFPEKPQSYVNDKKHTRSKTGDQQQSMEYQQAPNTARHYPAQKRPALANFSQNPKLAIKVDNQSGSNVHSAQSMRHLMGQPYQSRKNRKQTEVSLSQEHKLISHYMHAGGGAQEMRMQSNQLIQQQFANPKPKRMSIAHSKNNQDSFSVYTQPSSNIKSNNRFMNTEQAWRQSQRSLKAFSMAQRNRKKISHRQRNSKEPSNSGTFTQMSQVNLNCQENDIKLRPEDANMEMQLDSGEQEATGGTSGFL